MTQFVFTKGAGKTDRLEVRRDGAASEVIDCPKQGIIPHDMVHYAVESTLATRGFLSRVSSGEMADFRMAPDATSDPVERLVEVVQADAWSGSNSAPGDLVDLYVITCSARACAPLPVDSDDINRIRARIAELSRAWEATPVGGTLALSLGEA